MTPLRVVAVVVSVPVAVQAFVCVVNATVFRDAIRPHDPIYKQART